MIGAPGADNGRGTAYIRLNNAQNTDNEVRLVANDGAPNDAFGSAVGIFGR